ncbi:MAG TPA: hypothetical protein VF469_18710 [Kofleriaceae bacterium]
MPIHPLEDLIRFVREHSPYYRDLYAAVPPGETRLAALPLVSQNEFWDANAHGENRLLTGPLHDGVVFKSGGTTGNPKLSVFRREEWDEFCGAFGRGIAAGGVEPGERVANLLYVGELYASFLCLHRSLELCPVPVVQFPIGGAAPLESIAAAVFEFGIQTLIGAPTSIMTIAEHLAAYARRHGGSQIRKVRFGGEPMYPDQRAHLAELFPGIEIRSLGCASVDAGLLGYADPSCGPDEHRAFGGDTILEIVDDDSGTPITETGRPGRLVVTNLNRLLMPIVRYPSGDRAEWVEPSGQARDRKFRLLGRAEEGARVGPVTFYYDDVKPILAAFHQRLSVVNYQLRITHEQRHDRLALVIAVSDPAAVPESATRELLAELLAQRPMLRDCERAGKIHPTRIEWVSAPSLAVNPRTGKLRRVLDERDRDRRQDSA